MVSSKTLKLLDALLAGSRGNESEQLKALYKDAYCGTESFKELKTLLERSEFYGSAGRELLSGSEQVIQAGFTDAGTFGDRLTVMEFLVEKVRKERDATTAYIKSANISGMAMNVVDKRLADAATDYYNRLFNYICCFYASLYGTSILENLKIKTGIRSADLIHNVNDGLSMLIADAARQKKPFVWRIVRKTFGGLNAIRYSGFLLEHCSVSLDVLEKNCRRINPTLYIPNENSEVVCYGIGFLTNLTVDTGATVYGAQVISEPALNCMDELGVDLTNLNIPLLLQKIAGNGVCILRPETLVELLNRYAMIQTAKKNQETGCIFCGRQGCQHFKINKKFSM